VPVFTNGYSIAEIIQPYSQAVGLFLISYANSPPLLVYGGYSQASGQGRISPFARVTPVRYEKSTGQSERHENITSSSVFITRGSKVTLACAVDTQRSRGRARRMIFFMILEIKN